MSAELHDMEIIRQLSNAHKELVTDFIREVKEATQNGFGYLLHCDGKILTLNAQAAKIFRKTESGMMDYSGWDVKMRHEWYELVLQADQSDAFRLRRKDVFVVPVKFGNMTFLVFKPAREKQPAKVPA